MAEQLRQKFFELRPKKMERFVEQNLCKMLTDTTASVYSWNGLQGNIPVMNFKIVKILIGK